VTSTHPGSAHGPGASQASRAALTAEEIARAFSGHQFRAAYPFLADAVTWDIAGAERLDGREAVIAACESSAAYLSEAKTEFRRFRVLGGADWVVIDSLAEYTDPDHATSVVASCDIYRFTDGMLAEITSYNIGLNEPDRPSVDRTSADVARGGSA